MSSKVNIDVIQSHNPRLSNYSYNKGSIVQLLFELDYCTICFRNVGLVTCNMSSVQTVSGEPRHSK